MEFSEGDGLVSYTYHFTKLANSANSPLVLFFLSLNIFLALRFNSLQNLLEDNSLLGESSEKVNQLSRVFSQGQLSNQSLFEGKTSVF